MTVAPTPKSTDGSLNNSAMEKAIEVKYYKGKEVSHSYRERWGSVDIFCPACGHKKVWHELSEGDYYLGELYACAGCGATFHLPNGVNTEPSRCKEDTQRIERLRE